MKFGHYLPVGVCGNRVDVPEAGRIFFKKRLRIIVRIADSFIGVENDLASCEVQEVFGLIVAMRLQSEDQFFSIYDKTFHSPFGKSLKRCCLLVFIFPLIFPSGDRTNGGCC